LTYRRPGELTTEYIARSIRELRRFAREYDVDGSAAWFNTDHGICIHRRDPGLDETSIFIQKVRFGASGKKGEIRLSFDPLAGRYFA
jgi:hypothetical protein